MVSGFTISQGVSKIDRLLTLPFGPKEGLGHAQIQEPSLHGVDPASVRWGGGDKNRPSTGGIRHTIQEIFLNRDQS